MLSTAMKPRIYVACLAAYNNGYLHGEWIDATLHPDDIQIEIDQMLARSPIPNAEEWAIHDTEDFGSVLGENEDIEEVSRIARAILERGGAFIAFCEYEGETASEQEFCDRYCGEHYSEEDFIEEFYRDNHKIPEHLEGYIDWKAITRDFFISDFYSAASSSGVYVFSRQ